MMIEYYPAGYDYLTRFPGAKKVIIGEGETCYAASDGPDAILITDSSTLAYLLDEEDVAQAISVRRFTSVAERDDFVSAIATNQRQGDIL